MSKITLDIDKCYNYTAQIQQLNRRIKELDKDIYDLYDEIGWGNHKYLRQVDGTVSYSKKLEKCGSYLSDVGSEFDRVDNELYIYDISDLSKYKDISSWLNSMPVVDNVSKLSNMYADSIKVFIGNKLKSYSDKVDAYTTWQDKALGLYDWALNDMFDGIDDVKNWFENIYEEIKGEQIEILPDAVKNAINILSGGELIIDTVKSLRDYIESGDYIESFEDVILSALDIVVSEGNKLLNKKNKIEYVGFDKQVQNVLISTITNMPKNWYEGVKDYIENGTGTAGSIVVDTTLGAAVDAVASSASPVYKAATALTYPVVDQVCETFGYDLSGEYERLTGETGINAVFKAQKELWVDIVYEGAKEKAAEAVDGFYATVSKGWESWKSGVSLIFGRK